MSVYVIDSSIAVKWYFPESFQIEAKRYLSPRFQHIAPDFLRIEFANVLYKKEKCGDIDAIRSAEFHRHFLQNAQIVYFPADDFLQNALRIARDIRHPIYDCLYLSLAERESAVVVTADRKFHDRVKTGRYAPLIRWVEDPRP